MKRHFGLALLAGLAASFQVASASDITGTVTLKGTPPPEKEITPLENDAVCGKMYQGKVFTEFYKVGPNHGLGDVVVMLKNVKEKSDGASAKPAVLDQKGCLYHPYVLAIQTNQKLVIRNSDPTIHNVHLNPTVEANVNANPPNNFAQLPNGPELTVSFPAPENLMKINCDVHPWMFAWLTVVDNPYFAVTRDDGSFTIKNVPPGAYTITALHHKLAPNGMDKQIVVKDGEPAQVDFVMEVK